MSAIKKWPNFKISMAQRVFKYLLSRQTISIRNLIRTRKSRTSSGKIIHKSNSQSLELLIWLKTQFIGSYIGPCQKIRSNGTFSNIWSTRRVFLLNSTPSSSLLSKFQMTLKSYCKIMLTLTTIPLIKSRRFLNNCE